MVPIGKAGKIVSGESAGWYVFVEDDSDNTGGFLILQAPTTDFWTGGKGFDDWVETRADLERFFTQRQWQVQWLEEPVVRP